MKTFVGWFDPGQHFVNMDRPPSMHRREERFEYIREVTFVFPDSDDIFRGVVLNVSKSGVNLKVPTPLKNGDMVFIRGSHFPNTQPASVCWAKPIDGGLFLAGIHWSGQAARPSQRGMVQAPGDATHH